MASTSLQVPFEELCTRMKGNLTTNNWDILVSYEEDTLNRILAQRANEFPESLAVKEFSVVSRAQTNPGRRPPIFENFTYDVQLQLSRPTMRFQSSDNGLVEVKFGLQGKTKLRVKEGEPPDDWWPFGTGNTKYTFTVQTRMASVAGTYTHKPKSTGGNIFELNRSNSNTPNSLPSTGDIVVIDPGANVAYGVAIDFTSIYNTTVIAEPPDSDDSVNEDVMDKIEQYLLKHLKETTGLKYHLAAISNDAVPSANAEIIKPTKFTFTMLKAQPDGVKGTLCMWIQVQGTNSSDGVREPVFHPSNSLSGGGGRRLTPLPSGSNASIIFSFNLMSRLLKKSFESTTGLTNFVTDTVQSTQKGGMVCSFKLPSASVSIPEYLEYTSHGKLDLKIGGFSFDLRDSTTSFTISGDMVPAINYHPAPNSPNSNRNPCYFVSSTSTRIPFSKRMSTSDGSAMIPYSHPTTMSFRGTGAWKSTGVNELDVDLAMDAKIHNQLGTYTGSFQPFIATVADIIRRTNSFNMISPPVPNLNIDINPINYFLATNLLFPGRFMFDAHNPVVNSAKTQGLVTPMDTILTGSLKETLL